jgi:hypothetical protein
MDDPRPPDDDRLREAQRRYHDRRADAVARQAALTDFRLYWDALTAALNGREKVVVDADKVPGKRHLWLTPFEPFPSPTMGPPTKPRDPREGP